MVVLPVTTNLLARYRASDLVAADGARVLTLVDISGNGRDLTATLGAVYREHSQIDDRPTLEFSKTEGEGYVSGSAWFPTTASAYVVAVTNATDSSLVTGESDGVNSNSGWFLYDRRGDWRMYSNGSALTTIPSFRTPVVLSAATGGGTGRLVYGNTGVRPPDIGDVIQIGSGALNDISSPRRAFIGDSDVSGRVLDGDIYEVLIYGEHHSVSQQDEITGWLMTEYGLPGITKWVNVGLGVMSSEPVAVDGVLVSGASDPGGTSYERPTTGRVYPAPNVYN